MADSLAQPIIKYSNHFLTNCSYKNPFFNVLFLNIRSLRNKLTDLTDYVNLSDVPLHIIALNETWLKSHETKFFNLPGYESFHSTRIKHGGGVSIFIKKSFSEANQIESFEFENSNFLVVNLERYKLKIATIYKPPDAALDPFLNKLDLFLTKNKNAYIFGDLNIDIFKSSERRVQNYTNCVDTNNFRILNSVEPLMHTRNGSCIDHVLTDKFLDFNYTLEIDSILEVDHKALLLKIYKKEPFKLSAQRKIMSFQTTNHKEIIDKKLFSHMDTSSFENFLQNINHVVTDNTTTTVVREKYKKPFMSPQILNYMIIRNNYKKLTSIFPLDARAKSRFNHYRNIVTAKIRKAKRELNDRNLRENMSNSRKTWRHLNSLILNRPPENKSSCEKLSVNGITITAKNELAETFNKHFVTVADSIHEKIAQTSNPTTFPNELYDSNIIWPFVDEPTTPNSIHTIITNLSNSKSHDIYGISNHFLKTHIDALCEPLSELINEHIKRGEFPDVLKTAIVNAIFKGGNKLDPNCYRPIARAPTVSKIFEGAFLIPWHNHLIKNKIMHNAQFGFVNKSNIETALMHLLSSVYNFIEQKKFTAIVFIDIAKAFDCVDHNIFMKISSKLQLPKNYFDLLLSYFKNRSQCVEIDSVRSSNLKINSGIFQGSIFGPKAFIFYINGIFKLELKGKIQLYADDTNLVYGQNSLTELKEAIESDLLTIKNFFHSLKLDLNASKTKYILFNGRKRFENFTEKNLQITLDNTIIERVEFYSCLGMYIDEQLSFDKHTEFVYNKCIGMLYAIKRIRENITEKLAYQIYFAHVYSHLIFLNSLWSATSKNNVLRLFRMQKKCLRFIKNKNQFFTR